MTQTRDPEAGFTLIEALVAMAVLALGAVSLLSATEGHTARISDVSDRMAAKWAAEYKLTALRLGMSGAESNDIDMLGRTFTVDTETAETADPALRRVILRARLRRDDTVFFVLDGYIDAGGAI